MAYMREGWRPLCVGGDISVSVSNTSQNRPEKGVALNPPIPQLWDLGAFFISSNAAALPRVPDLIASDLLGIRAHLSCEEAAARSHHLNDQEAAKICFNYKSIL